ncbi:hypothetical protein D7191_29880 [Burkholderia cepacia]|nr:hypothetical protein [Burkholderia cepacia]
MRGARAALGRARHERRARRGRRGIGARRAERGQALTVGAAGRPPGRAVPGLCLLPSAFCLLPSAFCLLPSAFCLLPSAFHLPTATPFHPRPPRDAPAMPVASRNLHSILRERCR